MTANHSRRAASDSASDPDASQRKGAAMTDIIDLVLQDHHAVEELFGRLQAATGADAEAELFEQVKKDLECHAWAEEKVLYPRVRKDAPEGKEEVKDALEEHDQIRQALKEVEEHEAGTELTLAVAQLVTTTKHHVGVEEAELLPDFRNNSEASERESLGRAFEEAETKTAAS
jgi:hemerythrin superfamily protein